MRIRRELDKRNAAGKKEAEPLTDWLNNDTTDKGDDPRYRGLRIGEFVGNTRATRERAWRVVNLMQKTIPVTERLANTSGPKDRERQKEAYALACELNKQLKRYKTRPWIGPDKHRGWDIHNSAAGNVPAGELEAILAAIRLAKMGLLDRVRQCICGLKFYARQKDQRSCSNSCRSELHQKTDEFRAKRRAYMREYYKLQKSGKVK